MPELPEVETTLRGIEPHLLNARIARVTVRDPRLRWPVSADVKKAEGQKFVNLRRRGKYLLLGLEQGGLIIHLGMSGSLRILQHPDPPEKHDHVDVELTNSVCLRFNDPRRFGAFLWVDGAMENHELIRDLGPEPLSDEFDGSYLYELSRRRKVAVKLFIMNSKVVVGVGNIYANEALHRAGIRPDRLAGRVSRQRYARLSQEIKDVLTSAISSGGTTLRDFVREDGSPGYFKQRLLVYGRGNEPCLNCGRRLQEVRLGNRTTVFCAICQR